MVNKADRRGFPRPEAAQYHPSESGRTGESITNPWTNETSIINFVDPQRSFTQQGLDNPESIIFHTNRREDEWHIPECKAFSHGHR